MGRIAYLMVWLAGWPLSMLFLPTPDEAETQVPWRRVAVCGVIASLVAGAVLLMSAGFF